MRTTLAPRATWLLPTAVCPLPTPVVVSEAVPPLESVIPGPLLATWELSAVVYPPSTPSTRGALDGGGAAPSDIMAHLNILRFRCCPKVVQMVAGRPSGSTKFRHSRPFTIPCKLYPTAVVESAPGKLGALRGGVSALSNCVAPSGWYANF